MAKKTKQTAFATPLWMACDEKGTRDYAKYIFFIKGYAYVTDDSGHIVIKQSLELSNIKCAKMLNGRTLHFNTFKAIMQHETATADLEGIETPDGTLHPYGAFEDKVPDFETTISRMLNQEPENAAEVGLNLKTLQKAAAALGGSHMLHLSMSSMDMGGQKMTFARLRLIGDINIDGVGNDVDQFAIVALPTPDKYLYKA